MFLGNKLLYFVISLVVLLFNSLTMEYSQAKNMRIDRQLFTIHDYSLDLNSNEENFIKEIKASVSKPRVGLMLDIVEIHDQLMVCVNGNEILSASLVFDQIENVLVEGRNFFMPLFIDYQGSQASLIKLFKEHNLSDLLIDLKKCDESLMLNSLTSQGKRLLVFVKSDVPINVNGLNDYKDYISTKGELYNNGKFIFSLINHLVIKESKSDLEGLNYYGGEIDYVNAITDIWRSSGTFPSFLLTSNFEAETRAIMEAINNTPRVEGMIEFNNSVGSKLVNWIEYPGIETQLHFCMPIEGGNVQQLTPSIQGYEFSPKMINLNRI